MKINIVLPNVKLSGGVRMVFQYANFLSERGHDVCCYYPKTGFHVGKLRFAKDIYRLLIMNPRNAGKWFESKFTLLNPVSINNRSIKDGDIVMATAWSTCSAVQKLSANKGKKVYFVQDFETWGNDYVNNLVLKTYRMSWDKAVSVSSALHDRLLAETGLGTVVICNGIPLSEISKGSRQARNGMIVLGFPYRTDKRKNSKFAIELLRNLKNERKNIRIASYGLKRPEQWPDEFDFLENPTRGQLFAFYEKTDIFYVPSLYEGWGLPAAEAMGHGCAVVAANSGAIAEFGEDNQNCLILEDPQDEKEIKNKLEYLIDSREDRNRIGRNAWEQVRKECSFEDQALKFENILLKL